MTPGISKADQLGKGRAKYPARRKAKHRRLEESCEVVWARCGGRCERCGEYLQWDRKGGVLLGGGMDVTFHHVIYKSQGGSDKPDNLLALDGGCHDVFHGIKSK
jgi:hypothetical protein